MFFYQYNKIKKSHSLALDEEITSQKESMQKTVWILSEEGLRYEDYKMELFIIWEKFKGPKYHVLGNHDMDRHSKEAMLDFWGMPKTYYSFDEDQIHFIVLDANFLYQDGKFTDYDKANFYVDSQLRTFINSEQIEW